MSIFGHYNAYGSIVRASDGASIPPDPANRDYQAAMAAVAAGDTITAYTPPSPSIAAVDAERDRRLALGVSYDFGDARGVHQIGTTKQDLESWDKVDTWAHARHALGADTDQTLILTNTGVASITPLDWFAIVSAVAAYQQPIWAHAIALYQMSPIPVDFTADAYWQ